MKQLDQPSYSVVSLFCGLGALDLGFMWEGFRIVWANDNSEHAVRSHRLNFNSEVICEDIAKIDANEIPDADVIVGGPPCQSFSLLGQRQESDPRGQLVFRFADIVKAKLPLAFAMENVPGMAASRINGKRLPDVLYESFVEMGYCVTRLNLIATDYLVPQRRRRLFLVGFLGRQPSPLDPQAYSREVYGLDLASFDLSARAAIGDLGECAPKGERAEYKDLAPSAFARLMRSAGLTGVSLHERPRMSDTDKMLITHVPPGGNYRDIPDEVAPGRVLNFKRTGGRTTTYGRLHPDKPSYTINTYFRRPNVGCNFHYSEARLITPREAMRFQSIPDNIELSFGSQDQRNALIGNAVPPLMARAVAWNVRRTLDRVNNADLSNSVMRPASQLPLL